jgi:serine/threonine protein phosphatase PrpC
MNFSIAQESRIGGREVNQDRAAWLATPDAVLMVVADGMGGHLQGEVAAQIAIDTFLERFRDEAKTLLADPARFLSGTLNQVHHTIVRYTAACGISSHAAPRTTCIACVVQNGQATWAHAGDSRLYLIHGNEQSTGGVVRTRDHSVVQRMVDDGMISGADAAGHPVRNRVFSCLGGAELPHIEVSPAVALDDGDLIALCTDGAWSPLGEALVSELRRSPLNASVPTVLDAAEEVAGPRADNLTLLVMRWEAPDPDSATLDGQRAVPPGRALPPISDEEIDRAVAEIRRRIPFNPNGASS